MSALAAVVRLGPRRWPFLLEVVLVAVLVEVSVRRLRLPWAARLAGTRLELDTDSRITRVAGPTSAGDVLTAAERERCDLALRVLARGPFDATCLRRSLLVGHLLRGRHPVLRVGVAKHDGAVAAHAWLAIDGVSLDPDDATFRRLAPLPASSTPGAAAA